MSRANGAAQHVKSYCFAFNLPSAVAAVSHSQPQGNVGSKPFHSLIPTFKSREAVGQSESAVPVWVNNSLPEWLPFVENPDFVPPTPYVILPPFGLYAQL